MSDIVNAKRVEAAQENILIVASQMVVIIEVFLLHYNVSAAIWCGGEWQNQQLRRRRLAFDVH